MMATVMILSCLPPNEKYISGISDIKYGDSTEIIAMKGFFTELDSNYSRGDEINVRNLNVIFYPDQTVCYFFVCEDSLRQYNKHNNLEKIISKWGKGKRKWGTQWGVYTKKNNIIYTEMYQKSYMFSLNWDCYKDIFLLKNDTLISINRKCFNYKGEKIIDAKMSNIYKFIRIDTFPNQSNHFLKKQKWIWRNANDWNSYMNKPIEQ